MSYSVGFPHFRSKLKQSLNSGYILNLFLNYI